MFDMLEGIYTSACALPYWLFVGFQVQSERLEDLVMTARTQRQPEYWSV